MPTAKQQLFLSLGCLEAFYGGAARGGKSFALLMAALQYVDEPGYSALILRATLGELTLPGALITVARDWLGGTAAHWHDDSKTWTFPSGATLTFGYLADRESERRYLGSEYQFIAFDEATGFSEKQYTFLFSRLTKRPDSPIPLRMRCASNPGGPGHQWVKQRFIISRDPGVVFVPSDLFDNAHVDRQAYLESVGRQDVVTRAQMMGDWDILAAGNKFRREWFAIEQVAPADCQRVRYWDLAATEPKPGKDPDFTVGVLVGLDKLGCYHVLDVQRTQATPAGVESLVKQMAQLDGVGVTVVMEQEPGSSGKALGDHYRKVLNGYAFYAIPSTGSKEVRSNPVSAQAEAGNVKLLEGPWNAALLDELALFPMEGVHDDQVDALSGACAVLAKAWEMEHSGDGEIVSAQEVMAGFRPHRLGAARLGAR